MKPNQIRRLSVMGAIVALHLFSAAVDAQTPPPIAFAQSNYAVPQTPQTTVTVRYTGAQTAGNLNVVIIGWNDATTHVLTVTDTSGNLYATALAPTVQPGIQSQVIYYAANIVAAAANTNVVTVRFDAAADYPDVRLAEYSGIDKVNAVDVTRGASGTAAVSNSGAVTTTAARALLLGANYVQSTTSGPGTGFTRRVITSPDGNILEDRVVTAVGSYSATAPVYGAGWVMQLVAFRGASGSSDTQAPTAPTNVVATAVSSSQINLTWTASTDNVAVTGYQIERCQGAGCATFTQVGTPAGTTFGDTGLTASTSYSYRVRATDAANNLGAYSTTATTTTSAAPDTQAPSAPSSLSATAVSSNRIDLTWTASTDNVGVTGYRVERCQGAGCATFVQVGTPSVTTFSDTALSASTSYSYRVRATDAASNLSAYSTTASATTPAALDTQAPSVPASLTATAASSSQINLTWTASTDNVGVTGYQVERCQGVGCATFAQVGTPPGTTFNDTGLTAATSYSYRVRATDAANNLSGYSTTATASTAAGTPPPPAIAFVQSNYAVPQTPQTTVTVRYTGAQAAGNLNVVMIGWNDATTHVLTVTDTSGNMYRTALAPTVQPGIQSQVIYYAANIVGAAANANVVTVRFDAAADYPDVRLAEYGGIDRVNPIDIAGGASGTAALSSSGTLITTAAPALLVGANYVQSTTSGAGTGFTMRVITSPDGNILEDRVVTAAGSYSATAPVNGAGWVMQLVAFRAASGDTQPPTAPTDVAATPVSSSQINLSWTAATDNVGVTAYQVERCQGVGCTTFSLLGTVAGTVFSDTAVTGSTSYSYRVRATDAAGNLSGYSATASATTPPAPPLTVSISAPDAGTTLSGTILITATTTGSGIGGVQFQIDGVNVGPVAADPYSVVVNTGDFANGNHVISAYAWDSQKGTSTSAPVTVAFSNASPGNPAQTGLWSGLFQWPLVSVHINLLRDRRVLVWDKMDTGNPNPLVWDPVTSAFITVPTNDLVNLFCAGHVTLPDGRIFVAGGHAADHSGLRIGRIFDPATNLWSATPDMTYPRWYPTLTTLSDGRVLVLAGEVNCRDCDADIPEIYDPATNSWTTLSLASLKLPYYPHVFALPNGQVLVSGTTESPVPTYVLDVAAQTWSTVDARVLDAYSSAMYLPGKILKSGTSTDTLSGATPSSANAYVIDMNGASPAWRQIASMAFPRTYHVETLLPDGTVLVTGGGTTTGDYDISHAVYAAELWSPTTETWTTLSAMHAPRLYHGSAVLLADGRVLVSGSGRSPGPDPRDQENSEIFAPPYLFKGPRPVISSVPTDLIAYNQTFTVQTPDAARIAKAVLVAPGNMTHGINMNQRYLPLAFSAQSGSLTVTAPANSNLAPPGYYMLFLVDSAGVPSVASFVRF